MRRGKGTSEEGKEVRRGKGTSEEGKGASEEGEGN